MSTWTHVVGSISLGNFSAVLSGVDPCDSIRGLTGWWKDPSLDLYNESDVADMYWPDSIHSDRSYWDCSKFDMPSGSEGPLAYTVRSIGTKDRINNVLVTFFGNLRDYGKKEVEEEMLPYFEKLLERYAANCISVRCMAIGIYTEKAYFLTEEDKRLKVTISE